MKKKFKGQKISNDYSSRDIFISKYNRILSEKHLKGRPGEDYFEVILSDGKTVHLTPDEKLELDKLKK